MVPRRDPASAARHRHRPPIRHGACRSRILLLEHGPNRSGCRNTRKAYELRDRVSDRERLYILFLYDRQVTGNLQKELQTLEAWAQTYPRRFPALAVMGGWGTRGTGQYERGIQAAEEALRLNPDMPFCV